MTKIKRVEFIGDIKGSVDDEGKVTIPLFKKMCKLFGMDDVDKNYFHYSRTLNLLNSDGKESKVSCSYFRFYGCEEIKKNRRSDDTLYAVKITYDNGDWEYGFKVYEKKSIVRKAKLLPLYIPVANLIKIKTKNGEDTFAEEEPVMVPTKVIANLWNLNDKELYANLHWYTDTHTMGDFNTGTENSKSAVKYGEIPFAKKYGKVAYNEQVEHNADERYYSRYNNISYDYNLIKDVRDDDFSDCDEDGGMIKCSYQNFKLFTTIQSYVKSIYVSKVDEVYVEKVIPISDVLEIVDDRGKQIWDNMSSTLSNECF